MSIDLTKQYTTRGKLPVKLYDIVPENNKQTHPVIGAYFYEGIWKSASWMLNGNYDLYIYETDCEMNLIEVPTHNFTKDQLVLVWDNETSIKNIRYYSHFDKELNRHYVFCQGATSITAKGSVADYINCEPYYPTQESKPLEEGELVIVWDDSDERYANYANKYTIRRFHHKKDDYFVVTNQEGNFDGEYSNWDNCVRLSEFKL